MRRLRILTWHVHGSYLHYLTQVPHDFYVLSRPARPPGYVGRFGHFPWGDNVHDMPVAAVADQAFDCILFQHERHYREDQHEILSAAQRRLPRIFLEHDPPRQSPTDTRHPVDDPDTLLVHVTAFNRLMWDNGRTPTRVVEHGVIAPTGAAYDGSSLKGLVVVNHIASAAAASVSTSSRRRARRFRSIWSEWGPPNSAGSARSATMPYRSSPRATVFSSIRSATRASVSRSSRR